MASATLSLLHNSTPLSSFNGSHASGGISESGRHIPFEVIPHIRHSAISKQFIPVLVLAAFLLVLFVSHLLRFPRILYFSPPIPSSQLHAFQDERLADGQARRTLSGKEAIPRYKSFLGISLTSDSRIRLGYSQSYQPGYTIPTVRLVQDYHNRSPEPRVYLPEEITIPTPSSPTLVNSESPQSELVPFDVDVVYSPPSRVYFPPGLSEVYETDIFDQLQPHQRYTPQHADDSAYTYIYQGSQDIPALSSSPPAPFTPFYDLISTSSDALMSPLMPDPFLVSSPSFFPEIPDLDEPHVPLSPEISPPPPSYAHPFLVRRALSPWRRRSSPDPPRNKVTETPSVGTNSINRHRPSIPSRLRHFITRSTTASLSSSQNHTTPESSLGKRSEKSVTTNKSSLRNESHVVIEPDSDPASATQESHAPITSDTQPERVRPNSQLVPSEPSPSHTQTSELYDEKDVTQERLELREEGGSSLPATNTSYRAQALLGLGLGLGLTPTDDSTSASEALFQTSDSASLLEMGMEMRVVDSQMSLRTVLSRWMSRRREESASLAEEEGRMMISGLGDERDAPDESVEVMVVRRSQWEGL